VETNLAMGTRADAAAEEQSQAPWLDDVLDTIAEFGAASIDLVAWELCLPVQALVPAWRQAVCERLIEEAGRCRETAELQYRLVSLPARRTTLRNRAQ
jgi:hypothetical protein